MITTLEYSRRLKQAGCDATLAEELAKLHGEITQDGMNNYITKQDLDLAKNEILIKLGGIMVTGLSVLGFILKH